MSYYESHITIEPIFGDNLAMIKVIAQIQGFKVADLLMKKREEDTETRSQYDTFMTGHGQTFSELEVRMVQLIKSLQSAGIVVWRYKIEHVVLDSKHLDSLGLL